MIADLLALFNGSYAITAAAVGIFVLLIRFLTMLGRAMEFHDKHFVEKRLRRLVLLRKNTVSDELFSRYLDEAIKLEAFRLASGVRAGTIKAAAIMNLSKLGHWDTIQIRRISGYLVGGAEGAMPEVEITKFDIFSAWYGLISGVTVLLLGAVGAIALAVRFSGYGFLLGIGFFIIAVIVGTWLAMDFGRYKLAIKVRSYLEKHS